MLQEIHSTAKFLQKKIDNEPKAAIILGTGIGNLVNEICVSQCIPYEKIPHFPVSTVEGHQGNLIFGKLNNTEVVVMQGRFHYYEGYNMQQITFPIRVIHQLGIKALFISNACGGVNPEYQVGDLMIIEDHINLFPSNALIGKNIDELGPRFPDMSEAYDKQLIKKAEHIAEYMDIELKKGVYVGVSGPALETAAEYRFVRNIGGDAVGMSTVQEVIVARHMSIPCFGLAVITDLGVPGKIRFVTHEMVQDVASSVEPKVTSVFRELINSV